MNAEQLAEISQRAERLAFLVPLGEAAANGRIIEVELKQAADFVDLGQLIGTAVPALLAEVERLTTDATKATRWEIRLAETLHHAQLNEGELSAEVGQLTAERDRIREILATVRTGKPADLAAGVGRIAAIVNGGEAPC